MSTSVFEIIGPVMVGPSSAHTAGMARIGMMAHRIINETPTAIQLVLSPKLRTTYSGHRTDLSLSRMPRRLAMHTMPQQSPVTFRVVEATSSRI